MAIEVVHWNPKRPVLRGVLGRIIPLRKRVNNFGDLLGPEIVRRLASKSVSEAAWDKATGRLLAVGSILALARDNDIAWGIGANGKSLGKAYQISSVSFRAVRGPLTRDFVSNHGAYCPEIYGDPGLLVSMLWSEEELLGDASEITIVPNLNDYPIFDLRDPRVLRPTAPLQECLSRIRNSSLVIGSSLHAIVVAESFGIPARLISSSVEPDFKYMDYYLGTGRGGFNAARSVNHAIALGGEPPPNWDPTRLIAAFPYDIFSLD